MVKVWPRRSPWVRLMYWPLRGPLMICAQCEPGFVASHVSPSGTVMRSRFGFVVLSLATAAACRLAYCTPPVFLSVRGWAAAGFDSSELEAGLREWITSLRLSAPYR